MTTGRSPRHPLPEVAVRAMAVVAAGLLGCGGSSPPTRHFLLGVGPTWRHPPAASEADFVDMFQKVKGALAGAARRLSATVTRTGSLPGPSLPDG